MATRTHFSKGEVFEASDARPNFLLRLEESAIAFEDDAHASGERDDGFKGATGTELVFDLVERRNGAICGPNDVEVAGRVRFLDAHAAGVGGEESHAVKARFSIAERRTVL
jgi:hypothetical protein